MMTRHWKKILAGSVMLLALTACGAATPTPDVVVPLMELPTQDLQPAPEQLEAAAAANDCANPYLPVVQGATWNYRLTGIINDTMTRRIINVQPTTFTDQDTFGSGIIRNGSWQCAGGNLTALDPASGTSISISSEGVWVEFRTVSQTGITLPAALNPGDNWAQAVTIEGKLAIGAAQYDARNIINNNCTAVNFESVVVTAGTFNAFRVDCRTTMDLTVNIPDKPSRNALTLNVTNWYVQGVGLIKTVTAGDGLDGTMELQSHTIP